MVECNLAKVEVAGSNPVSRSNHLTEQGQRKLSLFVSFLLSDAVTFKSLRLFLLIIFVILFSIIPGLEAKAFAKPSNTANTATRVTKTANGRIDMCLSCHKERPDSKHGRHVLGCYSCHLGNPLSGSPDIAHKGMVMNPGELYIAGKTCGQEGCHVDQLKRVKKSLMATNRGIISTLRFYWGETGNHNENLTVEALKHSGIDTPAIDYFRKLCGTCHLWLQKNTLPSFLAEKGGGCTACHNFMPKEGKNGKKPNHPYMTRHIPMENCVRCHNRSGRIGLAYHGIYESEGYGTPFQDGDFSEDQLNDGRFFKKLPPDIHFEKGLICIDCHSQKEVMGDGKGHAHFEDQLEITCRTCHSGKERLRQIFQENLKKTKYPLLTNLVMKGKAFFLKGKEDKRLHPLHRFSATDCRHQVHDRLSCQACHSKWVPQCYGCHVVNDRSKTQMDKLSLRETPGMWQEFRSYMRYEAPPLGIKKDSKTGENQVVIMVPG